MQKKIPFTGFKHDFCSCCNLFILFCLFKTVRCTFRSSIPLRSASRGWACAHQIMGPFGSLRQQQTRCQLAHSLDYCLSTRWVVTVAPEFNRVLERRSLVAKEHLNWNPSNHSHLNEFKAINLIQIIFSSQICSFNQNLSLNLLKFTW